MRPYGIVVYPEEGHGHRYPARSIADGVFPSAMDHDDIVNGRGYPEAVFFEHESWRDSEMHRLLELFPNVMFCPVTLTTGRKTQPNPKATEFTISEKGVLPA